MWCGRNVSDPLLKLSKKALAVYMDQKNQSDLTILLLQQDEESIDFKSYFHGWTRSDYLHSYGKLEKRVQ